MERIIRLENVYKVYGEYKNKYEALSDINLDINYGEFIGVMGPSGSGKSTFLNIISTIDKATKGKLYLKDKNVKNMANYEISEFRKENIGFIFQECNLLETLTNEENIMAPLIINGKDKEESINKVNSLSKKLGIEDILKKYPSECSGGQRQRVSIARALSNEPEIIFADEPTGALDSKKSIEILDILKKLNLEEGITVVMVTHDQLMGSYCDKVVLIRDGEIDNVLVREYKEGETQLEFYKKVMSETSKEAEDLFKEVIG
ncbi:MAG: ABC transporter ATP-binding protein [Clostridium chrysemydis]|uniref:ABC transporter ATP-binding protein n=1 Tax=Clostridium TaxID=1485 RepID=UPI0021520576|nr:ABC transporter ATP-binding protein [Clostridium sp. LY3-2]MCR6515163.1 ABC transporter ATP-binding protein [Clostridium sp. LY3-2]